MTGDFCGVAGTPAAGRGWGCVNCDLCNHLKNLMQEGLLQQSYAADAISYHPRQEVLYLKLPHS